MKTHAFAPEKLRFVCAERNHRSIPRQICRQVKRQNQAAAVAAGSSSPLEIFAKMLWSSLAVQ
jgi:hypothetical protein